MNTSTCTDSTQVMRPGVLTGRSALVTGAGSGIGRGIALRLLELGMDVFGVGRREEPLAETAAMAERLPGSFGYATANIRDTAAIEALIAEVGERQGIDLLVNNAGGQFFAPATQISRKGWDAVIDTNLNSVFVVTKAAYPYLRKRKGAVVNISLSGVERGSMGIAHSIAARAGVLGLTRTLALEWAADDIALNCIGPGAVITEGLAGEAAQVMLDRLIAATPMGRATPVEDVAELVAFLATPAGHLMTGQLLQIDGAAHLGSGLHMLAA
ncbi:short-chain dehydrogenase [Achromobacter sp. HZ01]|mgnify:FL=1|uniref:Peroxisomal trans-2-enoyl-CoA reductase n=1 Tax=Achromobacter pulmonis TaxID=1389932 RepID=A0A2N8KCZ4_9BURK|nr:MULTISPECIES: SDR family oxidoreductase [Achromobacter]PND31323.1 short-chain dehydrogenase [Achromobacter pulmonis]RAP60846.1 short-chain dehydrogenase [Achromobacter sp. HZ01]